MHLLASSQYANKANSVCQRSLRSQCMVATVGTNALLNERGAYLLTEKWSMSGGGGFCEMMSSTEDFIFPKRLTMGEDLGGREAKGVACRPEGGSCGALQGRALPPPFRPRVHRKSLCS